MLKLYQRIHKLSELTTFFSTRQWIFHNDNTKKLLDKMDNKDKDIFCFDINSVQWDIFFFNIIKALRFYILKEPMSSLPELRRKFYRYNNQNNCRIFIQLMFCFRIKLINLAVIGSIICLILWWIF